ncbi:GNAT family N-acetyltransferase [Lacibacterium aquatile]|uniref:GNAT family N-acetyltransferase n=2 Tax=Lacibacterium aquatile TaxID=1168082 RepID=A0ABW5DKC3_9PROT
MPASPQPLRATRFHTIEGLGAISAADWDGIAGADNPFLSHGFLSALEESGSAAPRSGWLPRHLIAESADGQLVGAVPLYVKGNSWGEYVFDHSWADAFERAGGAYYPKLQSAIPFTPVPGPRLLTHPQAAPEMRQALAVALVDITRRLGVSSVHATFVTDEDRPAFAAAGFAERLGFQFHWHNRGYNDFEGFLADLSSRKRKAIRKERQSVADSGLILKTLVGDEITAAHWDAFHRFYLATIDRKWGSAYLTRKFFDLMAARLGDKVVLVVAEDRGKPVAAALNLLGSNTLYGRNWGASVDVPFLHFELCYYRALDFAIERGLTRVEAGAQGEHKLQRGYLPRPTYSMHWIANEGFRAAVDDFLAHERPHIAGIITEMAAEGPFRQQQDTRRDDRPVP